MLPLERASRNFSEIPLGFLIANAPQSPDFSLEPRRPTGPAAAAPCSKSRTLHRLLATLSCFSVVKLVVLPRQHVAFTWPTIMLDVLC